MNKKIWPFQIKFGETNDEMYKWRKVNNIQCYFNLKTGVICFKQEADATFFILKWGSKQ